VPSHLGGSSEPGGDATSGVCRSILDTVGRTPLIRLGALADGLAATLLIKLESENPGGSVKDRVALALIAKAERQGDLSPGGTIVEATAGNTGTGLAIAAAVKGYKCVCVIPDKMSVDKIRLLQAYGAQVVVTPTHVPADSPESYHRVADRLACELAGAWRSDQFADPANPAVHYSATGPEIWSQTQGRVSALVAGVGTGGVISGVGRYLKDQNPAVTVVGADPEGSTLSGDVLRPWKVEGIGGDFEPDTFDCDVVDRWIRVSDRESLTTARLLARREGLLVGGSTGTAVAAARRYAAELTSDDWVVILGADTGRNYLSTFFDDEPADGPSAGPSVESSGGFSAESSTGPSGESSAESSVRPGAESGAGPSVRRNRSGSRALPTRGH
jgi:cystathionine beta-synthase